jgi:hypothetical protein
MRGTIDLEHHPLSQPSVSAASVLGGTPLSPNVRIDVA